MNEFEDLLNSVSQVEPGDVVTAEVLTVDANQANVAIAGTGVEGVLTLRELTNDRDADINDLVKPGETLELLVLRQVVGKDTDTVTYLVSKKRLEARKAWDKLVGREEEVVTVKGTRAVKGGLSVEFEGLRGFIPASMLDTRFVRNTERFVGQEPVIDDDHRAELADDDRQHHHPAAAEFRQSQHIETGADLQVIRNKVQAPEHAQAANRDRDAAQAPAQPGHSKAFSDRLLHLRGEDQAVDGGKTR